MDHAVRRDRLTHRLEELKADAFLVTRLPNVRYLSGFTGSNGQLILVPGDGAFVTDGRYEEQAAHEVPDLSRDAAGAEFVPAFVRTCERLRVRRVAFEAAGLTHAAFLDLSATGLELVPTRGEVERLRWVKDHREIEHIREAQAIADEAFEVIVSKLVEGVTEREAALELDTTFRRLGAERPAFETIVAFGESAAEPHHAPLARPLARGDVVKLDFGCVVAGYHSDMTRTVSFGEPAGELRLAYEVVRRAQQAGVDAVREGVTGAQVDGAAREVIRSAGFGDRFKHGLGHGVGLEIHEGPSLRETSSDVLPSGAVVTVEPGIYLAGAGGVRIEDMVEVTTEGCRVIPGTPKDLLVLDAG